MNHRSIAQRITLLVALVLLVGGLSVGGVAADDSASTATDGWVQQLSPDDEPQTATDGWAQWLAPSPVEAHDGWLSRAEELRGPTVRQPASLPANRGLDLTTVAVAIASALIAGAAGVTVERVSRRRPAMRGAGH